MFVLIIGRLILSNNTCRNHAKITSWHTVNFILFLMKKLCKCFPLVSTIRCKNNKTLSISDDFECFWINRFVCNRSEIFMPLNLTLELSINWGLREVFHTICNVQWVKMSKVLYEKIEFCEICLILVLILFSFIFCF